ncbi:hypothetical protein JOF28_000551 [Leucobacter exalbidus]|uniref:PASTA domain-containing protein n=1 Tax=Leucobacter exalbidus TaxID=662960 RepID=A0A940T346_9MICO|nr:DUF2510 domain-containing protein [Leucobacter exalbidus]MBP1325319.1 hypothetical protein [Leucobacter exalbidus]
MSTPAGWYDDGSGRQRWWDGNQWADRFLDQDAPQSALAAATATVPPQSAESPSASGAKKAWYKRWWVWLIVGVLVLGGIGNALADEPESVTVPDLIDMSGNEARKVLSDLDLVAEFEDATGEDRVVIAHSNWEVERTDPVSGASIPKGQTVTLYVTKISEGEEALKEAAEKKAETDAARKAEEAAAAEEVKAAEEAAAAPDTRPVLDEITAAQFLALAWEERFLYGGTVHWIVDRITTANEDGTYTFKIGATFKNEYGTKMKATIEGDVGGTTAAPVILDSILYTASGEILNYY